MIRLLIFVFLCCFIAPYSAAQAPYLERHVSIRQGTYAYEELFRQISGQTGVVFSHTGLDAKQRISVKFDKQPLRIVLNSLFSIGNFTYKLKGKYVIVNCKPAKPKAEASTESRSNIILNGYILNAEDSSEIVESSVYLKQNKQSALTDAYGYFNLSFPKTADVLSISVAKKDFKDTTIVILSKQRNTLVIYLQPKSEPVSMMVNDSIRLTLSVKNPETPLVSTQDTVPAVSPFWKRFGERRANLRNISDTLFTNVSFSFVPPLSTNRLLSVNTVNKFSFNVLVGSSKGIDVMELGGLVNLDYGNVKSVQIGGLANLVSGTSSGVQVAGLINTVAKDVNGVQVAGLVNIDGGKVKHVQAAGIANLVKDTVIATQVAGIGNINHSYSEGIQAAGIYNRSRNHTGCQVAGIANDTDTISGAQVAGLINKASAVNGFQLSGLLNRAGKVSGSQLGFINVADSISGVPVGFFSFVRTGYHRVELACDENLLGTLSFRTGVDAFHNIFIGGVQISGGRPLWTLGYGLGSAIRLGNKWYLDLDLTAQQLILDQNNWNYNTLTKAFVGIEYRVGKKFTLAAGPTINWYSSDQANPEADPVWNRINRKTLSSSAGGSLANQLWIGGKVALRFF